MCKTSRHNYLKQSMIIPAIPPVNMELTASTSLVNRETTVPDSLEEKNTAFIFSSFSIILNRISFKEETMGLFELFIIAVGLSMDAFAVAICKGLSMQKMNYKNAVHRVLFRWISSADATHRVPARNGV